MFCSHCGAELDADAKFCRHCSEPVGAPGDDGFNTVDGVALGENDVTAKLDGARPAAAPVPAPVPSPPQYSEQAQAQAAAKKSGVPTGAIVAVAAVVVAVLAAGGVFLYGKMERESAARAQAEAAAAQEQADADATAAAAAEQVADSSKKLTVTLAGSDTTAFPTVSASIKVVDADGNAVTSLTAGDVKLTESSAGGAAKGAAIVSFVSNGGGSYQLSFTAQDSKDDAEQRTATIACASGNYEWDEIGVSYTAPAKEKKTESSSSADSKQTTTTQVLVVTTDKSADYMLPSSNCAYYSESDIEGLSDWELYLARNEIYARHGRGFNNDDLQRYFNGKSWYRRTCDPDKFDESVLNKYEKANASMILAREKAIGSQYI